MGNGRSAALDCAPDVPRTPDSLLCACRELPWAGPRSAPASADHPHSATPDRHHSNSVCAAIRRLRAAGDPRSPLRRRWSERLKGARRGSDSGLRGERRDRAAAYPRGNRAQLFPCFPEGRLRSAAPTSDEEDRLLDRRAHPGAKAADSRRRARLPPSGSIEAMTHRPNPATPISFDRTLWYDGCTGCCRLAVESA